MYVHQYLNTADNQTPITPFYNPHVFHDKAQLAADIYNAVQLQLLARDLENKGDNLLAHRINMMSAEILYPDSPLKQLGEKLNILADKKMQDARMVAKGKSKQDQMYINNQDSVALGLRVLGSGLRFVGNVI